LSEKKTGGGRREKKEGRVVGKNGKVKEVKRDVVGVHYETTACRKKKGASGDLR